MTEHNPLNSALERLDKALASVEAGLERRLSQTSNERMNALQDELMRLNDDRAILGVSLDQLTAHSKTLEATNKDVSERLDVAINTIRTVLETHGG